MHSLAYWTASVSTKIPFLSLFWSWVEGVLVLGSSPTANRVSDPKISVSNPSYLSLTVPWMEVDSEIYDGWLWTAHNWGQQSLYLIHQKCLAAIPVNFTWASKRVLKTEWLKTELKVTHVENADIMLLSLYWSCKCGKNFFNLQYFHFIKYFHFYASTNLHV